jgi:hypothetical protein
MNINRNLTTEPIITIDSFFPFGIIQHKYPGDICSFCRGDLNELGVYDQINDFINSIVVNDDKYYHKNCLTKSSVLEKQNNSSNTNQVQDDYSDDSEGSID